jgi:tetratricopeptide (TPR) repeat protein
MRILVLAAWVLLVPVALAYHLGPGQTRKTLDAAAAKLAEADRLATEEDYAKAVEIYDEALKLLPADRKAEGRQIRLERAKAMMLAGKLPEAHADLNALVDDLQDDPAADAAVLMDARSARASSQYYLTWLMRLEGLSQDLWEPEIESARQTYRLLAEQAEQRGDASDSVRYRKDLESAVRLARMDLHDLQGLPLPCQCKGCCSGQCKSKGKQPSKKKPEKQDIRGAGSGDVPEQGGR